MFVKVKLINGFQEPLIYRVPTTWAHKPAVHSLVKVPLQKRIEYAVVQDILEIVNVSYTIRDLLNYEQADHLYAQFMAKVAHYYGLETVVLYRRLRAFLEHEHEAVSLQELSEVRSSDVQLTSAQQVIVEDFGATLHQEKFAPALLHGVTGSGKTEVYKALMKSALALNKTVVFMVPEVSLAVQFTQIFKKSFVHVFGFHSATSAKERKELWKMLNSGIPFIIVGVHLPILLPLQQIGLIIIDEEHDAGFQEKKHPRLNSKEIALMRAQFFNIPILLGSATPSLTTLHAVKHKNFKSYRLLERFKGAFPHIQLVELTKQKKRPLFWISHDLEDAIQQRLTKNEQTLIFINRRGYSFFLQCGACSHIVKCVACSVSLTVHEGSILRCHYCNFEGLEPAECESCKGSKQNFLKKGIGTQQVVSMLKKLFPSARIERADLDSTMNKKNWQTTIQAFKNKELDILVGTQTITKGYHFPDVTLVGVIWADINMGLPLYQAAEITLQQLIQVAGRAGRQHPESTVILQTMAHHTIYHYLKEEDYEKFYDYEIAFREELHYPPYYRLAELELRHEHETIVEQDAMRLTKALHALQKNYPNLLILGPSTPAVSKVNHVFIRKIVLKAPQMGILTTAYAEIKRLTSASVLYFTPQPQN